MIEFAVDGAQVLSFARREVGWVRGSYDEMDCLEITRAAAERRKIMESSLGLYIRMAFVYFFKLAA